MFVLKNFFRYVIGTTIRDKIIFSPVVFLFRIKFWICTLLLLPLLFKRNIFTTFSFTNHSYTIYNYYFCKRKAYKKGVHC